VTTPFDLSHRTGSANGPYQPVRRRALPRAVPGENVARVSAACSPRVIEIAEQVEQATASLAGASVRLKSRVQVADLPEKPAGEEPPDLLYALWRYLAGDVGANAIRVTDVSDREDY
jgi:hypothetical protein